jgi:glycosyltransferase involved in cell wall biosynthesis
MNVQLEVFTPLPLTSRGPSYSCAMLASGMADQTLKVTVTTPFKRHSISPANVIEVLPRVARYLPFRWSKGWSYRVIEDAFLEHISKINSTYACHIWPDPSLAMVQKLKQRGVTTFREMINSHRGTAKRILDEAYERLGVAPQHDISAESVETEKEVLEAVDYLFCPSPLVVNSVLENGVPRSKLIETSYGWDPMRFVGSNKVLPPIDGLTALFVGTANVRKGAHLLLDYWARSAVKGRLVLAGAIEPVIRAKCAHLLERKDIIVLDYTKDVGAVYRSADAFLFPSLEEGSPLVIYEASGCGLPVITSPLAAGNFLRPDREGLLIDPYDEDGWIAAIRRVSRDAELRRNMSIAAAERAKSFVWSTVAADRRHKILDRLSGHLSSPLQGARI